MTSAATAAPMAIQVVVDDVPVEVDAAVSIVAFSAEVDVETP